MCAGFSSLDNLVANGVLNFDADSYVKGEAPKYYGNPFGRAELPFDQPIGPSFNAYYPYGAGYAPVMQPQPNADAYINRHEHSSLNSLKEVAVYGFVGGLIIYGLHKLNKLGGFFKDKLGNIFSKKSDKNKKVDDKTVDDKTSTGTKGKAGDAGKEGEKLAEAAKKEGNWIKRNWKKAGGWTIGIVGALAALAFLKSMFRKKPKQLTPEQMQMISQQLDQAQAQPGDPNAAQPQVATATPVPAEPAPTVAQAEPAPAPAPVVEVAQQTPQQEPVPEIQPVPPAQA